MNNIDWSKAPEWATHALVKLHNPNLGSVHWSCLIDGEHRVSPDGLWFHPDGYRIAEERPRKIAVKEWTGEGLPPVGTVLDWREKTGSQWVEATVLFITDSSVVLKREDGFEWQMLTKATVFRPSRTAEQLAAEEAKNAELNRMVATVSIIDKRWARKVCSDLYDAGYRKV